MISLGVNYYNTVDLYDSVTAILIALATSLCISMLIYSCSNSKRNPYSNATPFLLSSPLWLLVLHYTGGFMMSSHSVPYLIPQTIGPSAFPANSTQWMERVQCVTSIFLFHLGFAIFFGSQLLMLHRLSLGARRSYNGIANREPGTLSRSHLVVGICLMLTCIAYLSLWLTLHPPRMSECTDPSYLTYLFTVENTFLIFGIYLTLGEMRQSYQHHLVRMAFASSVITGILLNWARTLVGRRQERVVISTAQSFLYVVVFIFMTQLTPIITTNCSDLSYQSDLSSRKCIVGMCSSVCRNLCRVKSRRVNVSKSWKSETCYLSDKRRLTARMDVPSLPSDPEAPLSVVYY